MKQTLAKIKINEVVVVEGRDDTRRLKEFFEVDTIETIGSAINQETLSLIAHAQKQRGVIVLTDPDHAGERIRQIIMQQVPDCKHAFITKEQGKGKKRFASLGVEHASKEALIQAFHQVSQPKKQADFVPISQETLMALGLIAGPKAKGLRQAIGERLAIGYTNGKQLAKRLAMFEISEATLRSTLKKVEEESERV
ncbi:ribonuclease M5 [Enterococcus columbae]|uniref:Ribonuclease M5 n=1 Tax=Enterococcus columbae DSM 7374 = ATCC 51263 TaxID=1121865 RepID=S1MTY2_9ENTE|nr:ribonuclease M5 [Enterococcus columbae]EOT40511.1 ribonuclease M5 [Enterococcus columbae DSM 7374 = ATCC 51263]EOW80287.1 ribonuclease M5 [Enterococcus columbae DSM 7374 = ATCC 51263]